MKICISSICIFIELSVKLRRVNKFRFILIFHVSNEVLNAFSFIFVYVGPNV